MISKGRIAGVVIPDFAVVAYLKEHPDEAAQPLALVETVKDNASICAVNRVRPRKGWLPR